MAEERRGRRPAQGSTGRSGGSPKKTSGRPARAGDAPRKRTDGDAPRRRPEGDAARKRTEGAAPRKRTEGDAPRKRTEGAAPRKRTDGPAPRRRAEGDAPRRRAEGDAPRRRAEGDAPRKRTERSDSDDRRATSDRSAGGRSSGPRSTGGRGGPQRPQRPQRVVEERTEEQKAYDGPDLPEGISGKELDRSIAMQLKGLPEKLAARIAKHLVAAGMFIDTDPELAYQHAKAAKSRAQRIAVVREALGEAAYASGHYAEALAELRAAKRMNGATAYLPIMADCHRALGQPEQAIKLAQNPSVPGFSAEAKTEMTLVEAGARRDMGQLDAALRTLELAPLNSKSRGAWVVRLRYAYADTLEEAGRLSDALAWFHRTFAIDADELTDAAERAEQLEARVDRED